MARKTLAIAIAAVATVWLLLGIYHNRERLVGGMGGKRGAIRALSSLRIQTYYQKRMARSLRNNYQRINELLID
jgi:hypothetical protein